MFLHCDVLDHTNHIFSESLFPGDDNDQDKGVQKDKDKCSNKYNRVAKYHIYDRYIWEKMLEGLGKKCDPALL